MSPTKPWPPPISVRAALALILEDAAMHALMHRFDPEMLRIAKQALGEHAAHNFPHRNKPVMRCGGCRTADAPLGLYDRVARAQGASRGRLFTQVWLCPDCARKTDDADPSRLLARNPSIARKPPEGTE